MTFAALLEIAVHTVRDTLPMLPVLFVLYTLLELLSHQEGSRLLTRAGLARPFGPLAGALLGVIPQCGMSVFVTSLFLSRRVTRGTLIATYLATSDEALPVLLAHGGEVRTVVAIVIIKLVVGAVSGSLVDFVVPGAVAPEQPTGSRSRLQLHVETEMHHAPWTRAIGHSLRRTMEIYAWVFVVTLIIGIAIEWVGLTTIAAGAQGHPVLEVLGASVFGLIPNCSASIAIAEAYLRGVLTFGATVAGLCAGAGYGPILLLRSGAIGIAGRLLAICLLFSLVAGALVSWLGVQG